LSNPGGCTIHTTANPGPALALPGQYNANVRLNIEFQGGSSKKYVYVNALNKNGLYSYAKFDDSNPANVVIINWDYWGWWQWQ